VENWLDNRKPPGTESVLFNGMRANEIKGVHYHSDIFLPEAYALPARRNIGNDLLPAPKIHYFQLILANCWVDIKILILYLGLV